MNEENKDFKVIDRRSSSGAEDTKKTPSEKTSEGEGFVMKEGKPSEAPPPTKIDFSTLVFSLATGALIHLGLGPDPSTNKLRKDVELAKQNIDILEILKTKTKGNLSKEEDQLLENLLAEVQLRFVEACK